MDLKNWLYFCSAKKERDGLYRQRSKSQAGHRAPHDFAKKERSGLPVSIPPKANVA